MVATGSTLTPARIGGIELRNRVAFTATVNNLGRNREITDEQIAFYAERSLGGVGLVVTEGLSVHPTSVPNTTVPFAFDDLLVSDFGRMADAVHSGGSALIGQLWHVGRQALWNPSLIPWGPSGERDPYSGSTPHVMTEGEILDVVEGFVTSARNLHRAGFDGIELHGAHGYLLTQFLSPWSNRRDDRWGGSVENRSRLVAAIVRGIRGAVGQHFVVGLKLAAHEYVDGGLDLEGAQEIVQHLVDYAPPDYFAASQGNFSPSLEAHVPDLHFEDAPFAHLARGVRSVAGGIAVMAISKIPDILLADRLLDDGYADLIGMSRALLADPHLVRKVIAGDIPRPCIYCNVCWEYIHTGRPVACIYAPETGQESQLQAPVALAEHCSKTVHVVGGGPAGLEFARVAVGLGHRVHLHEREAAVGGRLAREARLPGRSRFHMATEWLRDEIKHGGGEISVDDEISQGREAEFSSDLVVIATGATPIVEPLPGIGAVVSLEHALADPDHLEGPLVIVDEIESEPLYSAAEHLAKGGRLVTVITRRAAIGRRIAYVSLIGVLRRLDESGINVQPLVVPRRVENGKLVVAHVFSGREWELGAVGTIIRGGPYQAREDGTEDARRIVGDASAPREILAVVREANARAFTLLADSEQ